jgi:hypothetical protein
VKVALSTDVKEEKPCLEISRASLSAAALTSKGQGRITILDSQLNQGAYQGPWVQIEGNQKVEGIKMHPFLCENLEDKQPFEVLRDCRRNEEATESS